MPIYLKDGQSVLFVHVPKTGGSSVETTLRRSGFTQHDRSSAVGPGHPNHYRRCSPQHVHGARLADTYRLDRFTAIFLVVRDPIARFRSEVAHRARKHRIEFTEAAVERWTESILRQYRDDPYVLDNHVRPQKEFTVPGARVYRYEDGLTEALTDLRDRFGLPIDVAVPHRLSSTRRRRGFASSDVPVSRRTEKLLRRFYRADFSAFGY